MFNYMLKYQVYIYIINIILLELGDNLLLGFFPPENSPWDALLCLLFAPVSGVMGASL